MKFAEYHDPDEHGEVLRRAQSVEATELAVFAVDRGLFGGSKLKPIVHVRPDDSTRETRRAAIAAFEQIVRPCIAHGKDGAIEVEASIDGRRRAQFCLVTLARRESRIVGAAAFIARFASSDEAHAGLGALLHGRSGW